ncbi:MAG: hypothetical protein M3Q97_02890, partial [Bacteroidota bacterium]|nr:hypothetical protein [Bacteroidota bacterium]
MKRKIPKFFKYLVRSVMALIMLVLIAIIGIYIYLNSEKGQRWVTVKVQDMLEKQTGTKVSIGSIEIDFPEKIRIHDFVILDHHDNPILKFNEAKARFGRYNFATGALVIASIDLIDAEIHLTRYK